MKRPGASRTRIRILDAAERVFADRGFEAAAIRDIAARARVTLPVLYYHFGSKTGLIEAVLRRRLDPIRQAHEASLEELRRRDPTRWPPALEEILEAMVRPALLLARAESRKGSVVMRLIGRVLTDPDPKLQDFVFGHFAAVRRGFLDLLSQCLPHLPKVTLYWRHEFTWGALALLLCNPTRTVRKTEGLCDPLDVDRLLPQFLAFCTAGLRAASLPESPPTRR